MKEPLSRVLAALEALAMLVPLTLLASFYLAFIAALHWETYDLLPWHGYAAPMLALAALGCLLCLWKAVLAFFFQGRIGLAKVDRKFVIAICLGGFLVIFGIFCMLSVRWFEMPDIFKVFGVHAYGAPALVSAAHIVFERHNSASNY
ncbi:hypothetical protein [Acidovorax sp. BL-A-41-H1]|uniref:hypothetical protein n=1 Tax=Acidovorax sp. BL-A-41-H1 TaxID=3421102 RepID=UPI003F7B0C96